ncbi:MAG TPA: glycine cleavage system protein GcvH [Dehalococcoidia bacterium]|nr:glycine cleavage system protein GcvH [Dehalococcoidia bacterium]
MEIPPDLKYTKDHEWVRMEGDFAVVGITDFAQDSLGDVVFLQLPDENDDLQQFGKFGEVESVKAVSDLFAPVSGRVIERNEAVIETPELVNNEPYGGGWLLKLELSNPAELESLMSAEEYRTLTAGD